MGAWEMISIAGVFHAAMGVISNSLWKDAKTVWPVYKWLGPAV